MGVNIQLPTDVHNWIEQCLTDMAGTDVFGVPCSLKMPPLPVPCVNCVADPIGMKSSNIYLNGGPVPFENGQICPMCHGDYILEQEVSVSVIMVLEYKFENFLEILKRLVRYPQNTIQTRGFVSDITNVSNCSHMETRLDIGSSHYNYKLLGEPIIPGKLSHKFFYAVWERI